MGTIKVIIKEKKDGQISVKIASLTDKQQEKLTPTEMKLMCHLRDVINDALKNLLN